jgi:hypothetical protein
MHRWGFPIEQIERRPRERDQRQERQQCEQNPVVEEGQALILGELAHGADPRLRGSRHLDLLSLNFVCV